MPKANKAPVFDLDDSGEDISTEDDGQFIDLSGVDERGTYTPVPPGIYDAWIDNAEYGQSKKGNNMITWTIKARFQGDDGTERDRSFFYHTVTNADSLPRLKRLVVRLNPDFDLTKFNPHRTLPEFIGRPCQIKVRVRAYEGQMRNDVQDVLPASEGDGDFMSQ
jgi:hypothetical protein